MRNHDRPQNKPHHEQRQGLQPVEKIHASLQRVLGITPEVLCLSGQLSGIFLSLNRSTRQATDWLIQVIPAFTEN
jgi:hypothetical protein